MGNPTTPTNTAKEMKLTAMEIVRGSLLSE